MKKKGILFKQLFLCLILFLVVPTSIYTFFYHYNISDVMKQKIYESTTKHLNLLQKDVDKILEKSTKNLLALSIDPIIEDMMVMQNSGQQRSIEYIEHLMDFRFYCTQLEATEDYIHSVYLYNPTADYIITSGGESVSIDEFFDTSWVDSLEDITQLTILPSRQPIDNNHSYVDIDRDISSPVVTMAYPMDTGSIQTKGIIIFNIYEKQLIPLTEDFVFLMDMNGSLIASNDMKEWTNDPDAFIVGIHAFLEEANYPKDMLTYTHEQDKFLINSTYYDRRRMVLTTITPINDVMATIVQYQITVLVVSTVILLGGLILSFGISNKLYVPIKNTLNNLTTYPIPTIDSRGNELDYIKNVVNKIIEDDKAIKEQLNNQQENIYEAKVLQLIKGKTDTTSLFQSEQFFLCVLLSIDSYDEFIAKHSYKEQFYFKQLFLRQIETLFNEVFLSKGAMLEQDKIVFLVNGDATQLEGVYMDNILKAAQSMISEQFNRTISFGVSPLINGIPDLRDGYLNALSTLDYRISYGKESIIYSHLLNPAIHPENSYEELFVRVINQLELNHLEEIESCLDQLFASIKEKGDVTNDYVMTILSPLITRTYNYLSIHLLRFSRVLGDDHSSMYKLVSEQESLIALKKVLMDLYLKIILIQEDQGKNLSIIDRSLQYIKDNYNDHNLDLTVLSTEMNISYSYLRKQIKEQTGLTYIEYLNKYRIKKAKELLQQRTHTIKEISFLVGYNNDQSFNRYFKKYEGMTPGEYRRKL
ncbi:AraC family transcriptional regulator [Vallitalea okinawensis]|uniref:AraC family transcriptional regulator n=1 Tax=Vallitalea okinawensis TaxID=2078660 RepID=UPI000CFADEF6|nr:helix-turn-helix domain-containing protein [Vallitalea okinawensis]